MPTNPKTRKTQIVNCNTPSFSVDVPATIAWLNKMGTMALADILVALDNHNLAAAQASAEHIKLIEGIIPWLVGPCDTALNVHIEYEPAR